MELPLMNMQGQQVGTLQVSESLFARPFNEPLVHQVIVACQANLRQGTRKQKGRSEIAKSTRKPWRQKGTGNARAGMASSPLWRGGGKIFPNLTTENFTHKVNRKMYRGAMVSLLTRRVEEKNLMVVDDLQISSHKTRDLVSILKGLAMEKALIVVDGVSDKLAQAGANLPFVTVLEPMQINPLLLMDHPRLLLTKKAVEKMEQVWTKS